MSEADEAKQKHVVSKFDYEDATKKTLISKIKFPEVIRDVKFLELANFSPSAVLFMFSCNILDGFFSNDEEEPMLSFSLGGVSTETRLKRSVIPSKSNVRELTVKMFHRDRAVRFQKSERTTLSHT